MSSGPFNISGEMSREQSAVQRQSDSSKPEPMREIPPEQRSQVDGRGRHEASQSVHANREVQGAGNIQAQSSERNVSQPNQDQGIQHNMATSLVEFKGAMLHVHRNDNFGIHVK